MKVRNTIALLTVAVFLTTSFEPALYAQDTPGSASKATVDKSTIERETPSLSLKEIMARAEKNIQKVNDEMGAIDSGVKGAISLLRRGGRICVISFHSIEDRAIKNIFKASAKEGVMNILTKKPVRPSIEEMRSNPRSRSAKLRAAEKIR